MKDILLIDKPVGWTSFDVVARIRSQLRNASNKPGVVIPDSLAVSSSNPIGNPVEKSEQSESASILTSNLQIPTSKKIKVGHAGTLDPFATGLLIILLGDACKNADQFLKLDKTYEFTAKLGEMSSTGDPEGVIVKYEKRNMKYGEDTNSVIPATAGIQSDKLEQSESASILNSRIQIPTSSEVQRVLKQFTGEITQIPPAYSAIKVNGKRAYKLAREGKEVALPSRQVIISRLEVTAYKYPYLKCVCDVSSGTYIRSLVEDIGKALGTGAYCSELRRTRIGSYQIENAQAIDKIVYNML